MKHICPNNLPLWQSVTKPQQTNEHMREVINHSTHINLLNTIKSWKTLQEKSLWQVDFDNLYFWNTLNKTHQCIFVWNRNNRLHTSNKKHMYKERKETTHEGVSERKTYININRSKVQCMSINGHKTSCTRIMYLKRKKRKDTYYPHYIP